MPRKRLQSNEGHPPSHQTTAVEHSRKRTKVGSNVSTSEPQQERTYPRASLLGLPPELRLQVYSHIFEDLVRPLKHAYDDYPSATRFESFVDLLLTCRQVCNEAAPLFSKDYAHRMIFYYENTSKLIRLTHMQMRVPWLDRVRFCLRYDPGKAQPDKDDAIPQERLLWTYLLDTQLEHDEELRAALILNDWSSDFSEHGPPNQGWTDRSFKPNRPGHAACGDRSGCVPYIALLWPPFIGNNCTLTCYTWSANLRTDALRKSCMVLEGKISDIQLQEFEYEVMREMARGTTPTRAHRRSRSPRHQVT